MEDTPEIEQQDNELEAEIKDTDIVFECTNCGKSIAIDYHGAGLSVSCPDCGTSLQVPIPEVLELADLDEIASYESELAQVNEALVAENDTLYAELQETKDALETANTELEELRADKLHLEKQINDLSIAIKLIVQQVTTIEGNIERMKETLKTYTSVKEE